jgi:hypothetical protein
MKTVNWMVAVFFAIISFLWFFDVINLGMIGKWAKDLNEDGPTYRYLLAIGASYIILFNLVYLLGRWFTRNYASSVHVNSPSGSFSIAISAIENSLRRSVKKLPEIQDAHVRVYKDRKNLTKPIQIYTTFTVWESANVTEVTDKIRSAITMRFNEIIEVKESPVFTIILSNIVEREHRKIDLKKKDKDFIDTKIFHGPEYPIDDID